MATRKRRTRRAPTAHRRRRRRSVSAGPVRRRRRRRVHHSAAVNPRGRRRVHHRVVRRRRYRRNPAGGFGGGLMKQLIQGVTDGFVVTLGRGGTKFIASKIPFGQATPIGQGAMQLLVGVGLSMAVRKFMRSERTAAFFLAGATSNVIQTALSGVPGIGPMLSGVGSWPRMATGIGSWPTAVAALPAGAGVTRPSNSALGQPWGFNDPNVSDGIYS